MKNYRIYILISIIFSVLYLIISYLAINFISKSSSILLIENEINSAKRRAKEISLISSKALENKLEKNNVVDAIQKSIEDVNEENIFLSVIDWSGKVVCYPDITKVGTVDARENPLVSSVKNEVSIEDLYAFISDYNLKGKEQNTSEIIRLDPIPNSDMIIATHINLKNIISKLDSFKSGFLFVFLILGLIILIFLLGITRYIGSYYYEALEQRSSRLEDGMLNLSKLNTSLENYQKNIAIIKEQQAKAEIEAFEKEDEDQVKELPKKRLLTYIRNELMPVSIEDISYIYVENTITYIVRKDGKRYTANDSLDQIYSSLDQKLFFRANRQIIVSIYAIDKIIKFGNNSLKIETKPASEIDIVIGKNKASSFKQWLDL
ncbi:LytTR family DNA-binding domain-containing protein [uncultured Psychroserpens sp.]|uniref:LytR/AlgR family response regulator transcription factor n=1 Tax=uncultured Psychroserpens sp. TaxID=255436 RepID=UPI002604A6A1|nr:LytTR family DNA-binding domain-containing protein [uncultured Psychroserpens sp.]